MMLIFFEFVNAVVEPQIDIFGNIANNRYLLHKLIIA